MPVNPRAIEELMPLIQRYLRKPRGKIEKLPRDRDLPNIDKRFPPRIGEPGSPFRERKLGDERPGGLGMTAVKSDPQEAGFLRKGFLKETLKDHLSRDEAVDWLVKEVGYSRSKAIKAIDAGLAAGNLWKTDGITLYKVVPMTNARRLVGIWPYLATLGGVAGFAGYAGYQGYRLYKEKKK